MHGLDRSAFGTIGIGVDDGEPSTFRLDRDLELLSIVSRIALQSNLLDVIDIETLGRTGWVPRHPGRLRVQYENKILLLLLADFQQLCPSS